MGINEGMTAILGPDALKSGTKANHHKNPKLVVHGHTHGAADRNEIVNGMDIYNPSFFNPQDLTTYLNLGEDGNGFGRPFDGVITSPNGGAYYFSVTQYPNINPDTANYTNKLNSFSVPIMTDLPSDKRLSKKSRLNNNSNYSNPALLPHGFNSGTHKRQKNY